MAIAKYLVDVDLLHSLLQHTCPAAKAPQSTMANSETQKIANAVAENASVGDPMNNILPADNIAPVLSSLPPIKQQYELPKSAVNHLKNVEVHAHKPKTDSWLKKERRVEKLEFN